VADSGVMRRVIRCARPGVEPLLQATCLQLHSPTAAPHSPPTPPPWHTPPGLEFSLCGPTVRFHCNTLVALCGATFNAKLDGAPVASWSSFQVKQGQTLAIGNIDNSVPGVSPLQCALPAALLRGPAAKRPTRSHPMDCPADTGPAPLPSQARHPHPLAVSLR
jgi:hypothetical protein